MTSGPVSDARDCALALSSAQAELSRNSPKSAIIHLFNIRSPTGSFGRLGATRGSVARAALLLPDLTSIARPFGFVERQPGGWCCACCSLICVRAIWVYICEIG